MLKDLLSIPGEPEPDEFGQMSNFASLFTLCQALLKRGVFPLGRRAVAVNIGARDGIGTGGNTDPTWPLFANLSFTGLAVEGSEEFRSVLEKNFEGMDVQTVISMATPETVAQLIWDSGFQFVDVLKVDIDGWDCDLIPPILDSMQTIKVVMVEYNVKYPPPIKMKLSSCPRSAFRSCARYHVYGCSLQFMADDVMGPAGYTLVQVDWQNAIFIRRDLVTFLQIPDKGVDLMAAYEQGYARRDLRAQNMPWNRDIDHLIEDGLTAVQAMNRTMDYMLHGHHLQSGTVLLGCGESMMLVDYKPLHSVKTGERVGDC